MMPHVEPISSGQSNTKEIARLLVEIAKKNDEILQLKEIILCQREQIRVLLIEIKELRDKLGTNSSNSSQPPSQDPNRTRKPRHGKKRKAGGQPGHPGHHRKLFSQEDVQRFINVLPDMCPNCKRDSLDKENPVSTEVRQQVELPEIKPEVTQYNLHTCRCKKCGKHVAAPLPAEARKGFGPRLMGLLVILNGEAKASRQATMRVLGHLGIPISLGSISNIQKLAADVLKEPYEVIRGKTLEKSSLNADESSWGYHGKRHWIWIGATKEMTFFKIEINRSQQAFHRVFGNYKGNLTTDRYSAYNVHEGKRQSCWAHLDRDFAKIAGRDGSDAIIGKFLQMQADAVFKFWRKFKDGKYTREEMKALVEKKIIPNVKSILQVGATANSVSNKTQATCLDLLFRFKTLWLFLEEEEVEPTNNLAERELRPAVIRRKISLGSQSEWGERFIERTLTIMTTFRQLSKNAYQYLVACFQARQRDGPIPSPL